MSSARQVRLVAETPAQYDALLQSASGKAVELGLQNFFVLFTGSKGAAGKSWCPDCVAAEPVIDQALSSLSSYVFLECPVDREEYRSPDYVYRTDDRIKLRCVPTLRRVSPSGKAVSQLNDAQSQQATLVRELLADE